MRSFLAGDPAASLVVPLVLDRAVGTEPPHGWRSVWRVLEVARLVVPLPLGRAIWVEPPHGWRSVWWVLEFVGLVVLLPLDRTVGVEPPRSDERRCVTRLRMG